MLTTDVTTQLAESAQLVTCPNWCTSAPDKSGPSHDPGGDSVLDDGRVVFHHESLGQSVQLSEGAAFGRTPTAYVMVVADEIAGEPIGDLRVSFNAEDAYLRAEDIVLVQKLLSAGYQELGAIMAGFPDLATCLDNIRARQAAAVAAMDTPAGQPEPEPCPPWCEVSGCRPEFNLGNWTVEHKKSLGVVRFAKNATVVRVGLYVSWDSDGSERSAEGPYVMVDDGEGLADGVADAAAITELGEVLTSAGRLLALMQAVEPRSAPAGGR